MRNLSLIFVLCAALLFGLFAQSTRSPHGDKLQFGCVDCHHPDGWTMQAGRYTFTHNQTNFALTGQHTDLNCKACHASLVFDEADQACVSCHTDVHQQTTGPDCARCHNPNSWLVSDITAIHRLSRFPLTGAHYSADCIECHTDASQLRFDPLPTNCFACHEQDYMSAKQPDHVAGNYATNCVECHNINAFSWSGAGINHAFFPLLESHNIDCASCHVQGEPYNSISQECISCHLTDYQQAANPNHQTIGFPTQCAECHDLSPDWRPANFANHDAQFFPVYSGKHKGEWESCTDCHTNANDFAQFSCTNCHEHNQSDMNEEHGGVNGYVYDSKACFECHPSGDGDKVFNHNSTSFPLTGAHNTVVCSECHVSGYNGTSTACSSCHQQQFDEAANPSHTALGLSQDCAACHSTNPDWQPATFPVHDSYYVLRGAHQRIASDCFDCHEGNYVDSPNSCFACHSEAYNQTTNPPHQVSQFSTSCEECHTEEAWTPATFDHDQQYFPIYSGNHEGEWENCAECHTNPDQYTQFSCIGCHEHNQAESDRQHVGISGYAWASDACYACHPTGDGDAAFDHSQTAFPLTGAHNTVSCAECHSAGYTGTTTICADCHTTQYNQSVNPNHLSLNIPTACADCHNTQPDWQPATFSIHNNYYVLDGAHLPIANDCASCHQGNYVNTASNCQDCHQQDYNQSVNPNHLSLNIPTTCADCHNTQPDWQPATFSIHNNYYVLDGAHLPIANDCASCHQGNYVNTASNCQDCHQQDYNQSVNPNHQSLNIPTACADCHNTQPNWQPATFPIHNNYYILQGAHLSIANDCAACHNGNYTNTPNSCFGCHEQDYNQTTNPPHASAQFPTDCLSCHTETAWEPSTFNHDAQYFPIYSGEHQREWTLCSDCHTNPTNYAVFSCIDCHEHNQADMADEHDDVPGYVWNSNACLECHPNGEGDKVMQHQLMRDIK